MPEQVQILNQSLDNNSTLQWKPPAGTQYEVVWRETAAAEWQRVASAESFSANAANAANGITVPISKDNVIFGVRSVDAQGHRSPAVVPWPTR